VKSGAGVPMRDAIVRAAQRRPEVLHALSLIADAETVGEPAGARDLLARGARLADRVHLPQLRRVLAGTEPGHLSLVVLAALRRHQQLGVWHPNAPVAVGAEVYVLKSGAFASSLFQLDRDISETIGAIGVSGAVGGDKDEACATSGIERVVDKLK